MTLHSKINDKLTLTYASTIIIVRLTLRFLPDKPETTDRQKGNTKYKGQSYNK